MDNPKPLFSKKISCGTRVYYVDVHSDKKNQKYVVLSEISTDASPKKLRQKVFVHHGHIEQLADALREAASFIKDDSER